MLFSGTILHPSLQPIWRFLTCRRGCHSHNRIPVERNPYKAPGGHCILSVCRTTTGESCMICFCWDSLDYWKLMCCWVYWIGNIAELSILHFFPHQNVRWSLLDPSPKTWKSVSPHPRAWFAVLDPKRGSTALNPFWDLKERICFTRRFPMDQESPSKTLSTCCPPKRTLRTPRTLKVSKQMRKVSCSGFKTGHFGSTL